MSQRRIEVLPDPDAVAEEAARRVVGIGTQCIADRGGFTLALSGGQTPLGLYQRLGREPYLSQLDWSRCEVFFTDERAVPPYHADSNYGMAEATMLTKLPIPAGQVHRIRGEADPEAAAIEYGKMLRTRFGDGGLDLALLGMGEDGHTASLFPGTAALSEREHRCVPTYVENRKVWRITLSAPFLNRSRQILILVTGANKATRVQEALNGERDPMRLPIQLIDPPTGEVTWLLDAAAAART